MTCMSCGHTVAEFSTKCNEAINQGDLISLKCLLADGDVTLHSRDTHGRNLLDISLHALKMSWLTNELISVPHVSRVCIVDTGLWLLSRGLTVSSVSLTECLPGWMEFANMKNSGACSDKEIHKMGLFLEKVSKDEPPILRAARLIGFMLWNPGQTALSTAVITDVIQEQMLRGRTLKTLNEMEKDYWKESDVLSPGIESILLRPMITLKRNPVPEVSSEMRYSLRGARWLLIALLNLGLTEPVPATVAFVANYIMLCNELPLLADGFRDMVTILADRNGLLDIWVAVLKITGASKRPVRRDGYWDILTPYLGQFHLQEDQKAITIISHKQIKELGAINN